jgi:hypothetical protein
VATIIFGGLYIIQALIGNYLEPVIAGKALAISPLAVLVAFFFWAFLWGIPGALIGVPVMIALYTLCEQHPSTHWIAKLLSSGSAASTRGSLLPRKDRTYDRKRPDPPLLHLLQAGGRPHMGLT